MSKKKKKEKKQKTGWQTGSDSSYGAQLRCCTAPPVSPEWLPRKNKFYQRFLGNLRARHLLSMTMNILSSSIAEKEKKKQDGSDTNAVKLCFFLRTAGDMENLSNVKTTVRINSSWSRRRDVGAANTSPSKSAWKTVVPRKGKHKFTTFPFHKAPRDAFVRANHAERRRTTAVSITRRSPRPGARWWVC